MTLLLDQYLFVSFYKARLPRVSRRLTKNLEYDIEPLDCLELEVNKAGLPMVLGKLNQEFRINTGPLI